MTKLKPQKVLYYVTGNESKFKTAKNYFEALGVKVLQKTLRIPEIQSDSIEEIATDKAQKAYSILKHPLFVSDSCWYITALKGFPGPYMNQVNQWLTSKDFLNLMKPYKNREIILHQAIAYTDEKRSKVFIFDTPGRILKKPKGPPIASIDQIVSVSSNGLSIGEEKERCGFNFEVERPLWEKFFGWWLSP